MTRPTKASRPKRPPRAPTTSPPSRTDRRAADRGAVTLAVVTGAHGLGGEVRLKVFADDLGAYASLNGGALTLVSARPAGGALIARFAEVADRTAAEALRGTELTVPRAALPPLAEDEYYHADLIGLPCEAAGEPVGHVVAVENFGAGDLVEIERPAGARVMVPVARAVTIEPDRLVIDPAFVI